MMNHNLAWVHVVHEYNERVRNAERKWHLAQGRFEKTRSTDLGIANDWLSKLQTAWQQIAGVRREPLSESQECCEC